MLRADKTVTVVNIWPGSSGDTVVTTCVVDRCSWRTEIARPADNGRTEVQNVKVRLPHTGQYHRFRSAVEVSSFPRQSFHLGPRSYLYAGALPHLTVDRFRELSKAKLMFQVSAVHENLDGIDPHIYAEGEA